MAVLVGLGQCNHGDTLVASLAVGICIVFLCVLAFVHVFCCKCFCLCVFGIWDSLMGYSK